MKTAARTTWSSSRSRISTATSSGGPKRLAAALNNLDCAQVEITPPASATSVGNQGWRFVPAGQDPEQVAHYIGPLLV